jgi:glucan biosynthesis protein
MSSSRRRSSKKESYWREQVAKWRASGLSLAEFSRQAEISDKSLGHWKPLGPGRLRSPTRGVRCQ